MNKTLVHILFSILLIVLGVLVHRTYYSFSLSMLDLNTVSLTSTKIGAQFTDLYMFCIALGFLPIGKLLVEKLLKTNSSKQSVSLYSTMLVSGIVFWRFRLYQIDHLIESVVAPKINGLNSIIPIESLKISQYLLYGVLVGFVVVLAISILVKRKSV